MENFKCWVLMLMIRQEKLSSVLILKNFFVLFCSVLIDSSSCVRWPGSKCFFKSKFVAHTHSLRRQDTELCVAKDVPILCVFPFYGKDLFCDKEDLQFVGWGHLGWENCSFFLFFCTYAYMDTHTHPWVNVKSFTSTNGRKLQHFLR